jgi:hypothetical protein
MKYIFTSFIVISLLFPKAHSSEGSVHISFAGVFDEGIYDQTPIRRDHVAVPVRDAAAAADADLGEERDLIQILKSRKEEQLGRKYLSTLARKIRGFRDALRGEDQSAVDRLLDDTRRNPFAGITSLIYCVGRWFNQEDWGRRRLREAREVDNPHLEFEIKKIEAEMISARDALAFEPVSSLEEQYVLRKPYLNIPLQRAVERSLLLYRGCTGHLLAIESAFIRQALSLPLGPRLVLERGDRRITSLRALVDRGRHEFSTFSPAIQRELENVIVDMANFSMVPPTYTGARRVVRYYWGGPGGGKTTTVLKLAEILRLPIVKVSIGGAEDLSAPRLKGQDRFSFSSGNMHGWFLSPLLEPTIELDPRGEVLADDEGRPIKRTVSNPILLVDDIDLEMGAAEVLAALKLYLDPTTRDFDSPYFSSPIDVSRMHVFVTSNQKIPDAPEDGSMDKYAALRSRVRQINFPIFGITDDSSVLKKYVREEAEARGVLLTDEERETALIITATKDKLERERQTPDMRNMRAGIATFMTEIASDSIDAGGVHIGHSLSLLRLRELLLDPEGNLAEYLGRLRALAEEFIPALRELHTQAIHSATIDEDVSEPFIQWLVERPHLDTVKWVQKNRGIPAVISGRKVTTDDWVVSLVEEDGASRIIIEGAEPDVLSRQWAWAAEISRPEEINIGFAASIIDADTGAIRPDYLGLADNIIRRYTISSGDGHRKLQQYIWDFMNLRRLPHGGEFDLRSSPVDFSTELIRISGAKELGE